MNLPIKIKRDLLIVIISIIIGTAVGIFLYKNLLVGSREKIEKNKKSIKMIEGEINRKKMMQVENEKFKSEQLNIESKTLKFKELIPHTVDNTKIMKLLENLSNKYEFKDMKVDILPLVEINKPYFKKQFRVYFQGRYENIVKFLMDLQDSHYLINIEEVDINRNPKIVPLIEVTCKISTIQSSSKE